MTQERDRRRIFTFNRASLIKSFIVQKIMRKKEQEIARFH